jgi:hypothetical protein
MGKVECHSGLPLDPEEWCDKDVWELHWENGLSVSDAYIEEC